MEQRNGLINSVERVTHWRVTCKGGNLLRLGGNLLDRAAVLVYVHDVLDQMDKVGSQFGGTRCITRWRVLTGGLG
jgi:hypothetical protein